MGRIIYCYMSARKIYIFVSVTIHVALLIGTKCFLNACAANQFYITTLV